MSSSHLSAWTVRSARSADLADLRRISVSAFDREPDDRAALAELFLHRDDHRLGLVATSDGGRIAGFAFGSAHDSRGYIDAFAVDGPARRRGVATALLTALENALVDRGVGSITIGGNGHFYAWPGIDLGYAAALALAERRGYRDRRDAQNMEVPLDEWAPGSAGKVLRRQSGRVRVQRATADGWPDLSAFVAREFTDGWRDEAARAMDRDVPTVFVAFRGETVVGFACHGVYRTDWFGPIGTASAERGSGIGEALLRMCLDDLARTGVRRAQIAWVGPTGFYSRTVGARIGRQFAILQKSSATEVRTG